MSSARAGYSVVPVPKAFFPLRIVQLVFGLIVLGISAYHVSLYSGTGYSYDVSPVLVNNIQGPSPNDSISGWRDWCIHRSRNHDLHHLLDRGNQSKWWTLLQLLGHILDRALRSDLLACYIRAHRVQGGPHWSIQLEL